MREGSEKCSRLTDFRTLGFRVRAKGVLGLRYEYEADDPQLHPFSCLRDLFLGFPLKY